jgi:hypothetical protein
MISLPFHPKMHVYKNDMKDFYFNSCFIYVIIEQDIILAPYIILYKLHYNS